MKILLIKKNYIYIVLILFIFLSGLLLAIISPQNISTYKDRNRWEESGDIIWEIKTDEKAIALTFDDGPDPIYTQKIIDLLADYDANATFFVVGEEVKKYPDLIKKMSNDGHEIANHTYSHQEVNKMSLEELIEELEKTHQTIYQIINQDVKLYRPTSGFYNDIIVEAARKFDYTVVIWTWGMDSKDWLNINHRTIANNIYKNVEPGNIILFHDRGGKRDNTIRALHIILPVLKEQGYEFLTISELLDSSTNQNSCYKNSDF